MVAVRLPAWTSDLQIGLNAPADNLFTQKSGIDGNCDISDKKYQEMTKY